jgi:Ca2+-binding RTX toxin-like protein
VVAPTGAANPDVTWLGGTTHVVSYRSQAANSGISFNIVNGSSVGSAIGISGVTGADVVALTDPATGLPNGDFAVIVEKGAAGIEARLYDSNGVLIDNDPIVIAGAKPNSDFDCVSVTALKGGGFAVAYIAADGTDLGDVYVRVIDANGVAGTPIKVNARASVDSFGSQKDPQISEMADGRLSVSWHDPTLGNGLISTMIVDLRTSKVTVTGTTQNDLYAASEYAGDTLDGGAGVDTLTFKGTTTGGVTVNLATQSGSAGDGAGDSYKNFENIIGSNFNDTLVGGAGSNKLEGRAGDDYLDGGADADILIGGSGTDTYIVNHAGDVVQETSAADGLDTVYTSVSYTLSAFVESLIASGSDAISLTGNGLNNTIIGNGANNALNGGGGDDVLSGGGGADFMDGGAGNDVYYIDDAGDRVTDGSGVDTVYLSVSYDLARLGSIENITGVGTASITLTGTAAANVLTGNDSANILYGGAGNDVLSGGAGNDRIHGQEGQDVLSGGSGRDIFVFDRRPNKSTNVDKILDFTVRDDSIYLENKYFKVGSKGSLTKPAPLASKMLHKGSKAHDADDRIIYDNKKGILYYDADGTGAAVAIKIATLSKNLKMTYKDFFVI